MDYGTLPKTGIGALSIGGLMIDQTRLVTIAVIAIVLGAGLIRLSFRRRQSISASK
jgi:hypothetical protein